MGRGNVSRFSFLVLYSTLVVPINSKLKNDKRETGNEKRLLLGMKIDHGDLRPCAEPDSRDRASFHTYPSIYIHPGLFDSIETGLVSLSKFRKGDERAVERQRDLASVRMARAVGIDRPLGHLENQIGVVVQEQRAGSLGD